MKINLNTLMILDSDQHIKKVSQTAVLQLEQLETTARQIKDFAKINYISKVTEEVYDLEKGRPIKYLDSFYVNPEYPIFRVGSKHYKATDQEKVLQWLINRVEYYRSRVSSPEREIIHFTVS